MSTIEEPRTDEVQEGRTGHRFTFGLWTVGNPGPGPVRRADARADVDPVDSVHKLAELGAWGVSLHDDDLIPLGSATPRRRRSSRASRARSTRPAWASGWPRRTCSAIRRSRTARSPPTTAASAARRSARRCASSTSPPSSAPRSTSSGAGARAPRSASPRTRATRSSATARRSTSSALRQGQRLRPALRDGAQAQRAARGHLPADRRPRAALHRDARATRRWWA